jgi:hypothetical protein
MNIVTYCVTDWGNNDIQRGAVCFWPEEAVSVCPPAPSQIAMLESLWIVPGTINLDDKS